MANALITRKESTRETQAFGGGYNTGTWIYTDSIYCPNGVQFIGMRHSINDSRVISGVGYEGSNDNKTFTEVYKASGSASNGIYTLTDSKYKYYRAKYYANWGNRDATAMAGVKALAGGVLTKLLTFIANIFRKEVLA
jgi:hypothetical protein